MLGQASRSAGAALPLVMLPFLGNPRGPVAVIARAVGSAGVVLLPVCRVTGVRLGWTRARLRYLAVMGLISLLAPMTVFHVVVRETPSGMMAAILTLVPLVTCLMVPVTRMKRFARRRAAGLVPGSSPRCCRSSPAAACPTPAWRPMRCRAC